MHIRLDSHSPFYIGKGSSNRAYSSKGRNIYWNRIANKHGYKVLILIDNLLEQEAFWLEQMTILRLQDEYTLVNMTEGGEGITRSMPLEVKDKIKKTMIKKSRNNCLVNKPRKLKPHRAKEVIDIVTGQSWSSAKEASKGNSLKYRTLICKLSGNVPNNTNLRYKNE